MLRMATCQMHLAHGRGMPHFWQRCGSGGSQRTCKWQCASKISSIRSELPLSYSLGCERGESGVLKLLGMQFVSHAVQQADARDSADAHKCIGNQTLHKT